MKLSKEAAIARFGACKNFLATLDHAEEAAFENMDVLSIAVFGENRGKVFTHANGTGRAVCSECGITIKTSARVQNPEKVISVTKNKVYSGYVSQDHRFGYPPTTSVELPGNIVSRCQHHK